MNALVTATSGRINRAWLAMIAHLREENSEAQIVSRILAGRADVLSGTDLAGKALAVAFTAAYVNAGQTAARWLDSEIHKRAIAKKIPVFDPTDPPAAHWAAQNRLDLIREIDDETRMMVRDVLMEGARLGTNPLEMAREIRESIGLTTYQQGIVDNYRRELMRGDYTAALHRELTSGHSDRAVAAALRANRPMTQAQIDTAVERYRQGWIDYRARTIARTEGLRVAHQGSDEMIRQAVERGDIDAEQVQRTWIHQFGGARATRGRSRSSGGKGGPRPFHVVMNNQVRGFGEKFVSGLGAELRFPCDPQASAEETANCHCVVTTRILPSTAQPSQSGTPGGGQTGGAAEDVGDEMLMDEAAAEDEAAAFDEEQQAAETADLEQEFADESPVDDVTAEPSTTLDLADLEDVPPEPPLEDVGGFLPRSPGVTELTPPTSRAQQLQQAQQRLAARRAALDNARAELVRLDEEHTAAQREVEGFRIGVTSEIAGETELDETSWLAEQQAALERAQAAADASAAAEVDDAESAGSMRIGVSSEIAGEPSVEAAPRDVAVPSDKPAPLGYESVEYNGELYYRHQIDGRAYTPEQYALTQRSTGDSYAIELSGPNPRIAGYETIEIKTPTMSRGQLRYRSKASGHAYTPEAIASGEAAAQEEFLAHPPEQRKPGLLSRIWSKLTEIKPLRGH